MRESERVSVNFSFSDNKAECSDAVYQRRWCYSHLASPASRDVVATPTSVFSHAHSLNIIFTHFILSQIVSEIFILYYAQLFRDKIFS